jgi:Spy/CpxP family protein refolding chaperone
MKKWGLVVVAVAVVAMTAPAARAQGRRGGGGMGAAFLLGQKSVQEELKLSEDQITKVKEIQEKGQEARRGLRDIADENERRQKAQELAKADEKAIGEVLKPEQVKRLKQIELQFSMRRGPQAFANEEVAAALNLTAEQKEKLKTINDDFRKETEPLRGFSEENRKKREELAKAANDKVMGALTDEQKTKLKELTGEPFKGEIVFPQRKGGNR